MAQPTILHWAWAYYVKNLNLILNWFLKIELLEIKIGDSYDVYLAFGDIIHLKYLDKPLFLGFLKDEIKDDANTHLRLAWRMIIRNKAQSRFPVQKKFIFLNVIINMNKQFSFVIYDISSNWYMNISLLCDEIGM